MKQISLMVVVLALALATCPAAAEETLLLLARHAEKTATAGNPNLTPRGLARAEALADIAENLNVRAVYSTDLCRTALTAQPLAARLGMPITVQATGSSSAGLDDCSPEISSPAFFLDPKIASAGDLLASILDQHAGQAVLVVGHSNTVPQMLASLGLGAFEISEDQYDRLFMVTYDSELGAARMVESSYGEGEMDSTDDGPRSRLAVVDRAIEHHGGELYRSSRTRLTISSKSGSFDLSVTRNGDAFEYVVDDSSDGAARQTRITNDSTERSLDGEPQPLDSESTQRARDFAFARVYFPFLPYGLNDPDVFKLDQGLEEWDGRQLHRVRVTFAAGSSTDASDDYAYWFDPETGRLEQYAYSFGAGGANGGLRLRRLSNYRRIEGLLFFDAGNIGFDAAGDFSVDLIDPTYVSQRMQPISEVVLSAIEVTSLAD